MSVPPLAKTVAAFDARSPDYDRSVMHRVGAEHAVAAADPQPGQTLLDLAGGTGLVARAALPRVARAVVLDASPGMLRQARRAEPRLLLVRADAHRAPLSDDSVDLVTCVTALHLFAEPERALQEAGRVSRHRIVFTTWAASGWSAGRTFRAAAAEAGIHVPDPAAASGTAAAAAALARRAGLEVEEVRTLRCAEPVVDREAVWAHVSATPAARATPGAAGEGVRVRFEELLAYEVEHALLLVVCWPSCLRQSAIHILQSPSTAVHLVFFRP